MLKGDNKTENKSLSFLSSSPVCGVWVNNLVCLFPEEFQGLFEPIEREDLELCEMWVGSGCNLSEKASAWIESFGTRRSGVNFNGILVQLMKMHLLVTKLFDLFTSL